MTTATISAVLPRLRRRSELGLILFSAVIIGGAYTLASLGRTASIPANIGPFLGMVLGLVLIAHLAVRRLAPAADGILLPVAGLLNGLGYVVIARLDQQLAGLQATWTAVGILAFIAHAARGAPHRATSRPTATRSPSSAWGCCCCPCCPASAGPCSAPALGLPRADQLPAGRGRQDLPGHLPRGLPGREARAARHGHVAPLPPVLPDPKHLGPILAAVGMSLLVHGVRERLRLSRCCSSRCSS